MRIKMPAGAAAVISVLEAHGYEAYAVGGCVRDSILMRTPDDWDITTSAAPEEVKALFSRTVDTGLKHGTVTVLMGKDQYEVTTYRIDGEYEDGRHPKEVIFTASLAEDLKRRDFTINAMAYSDREGLVDLFGGMEDLQRKLVRCVGDPGERFGEDALRILRAVRFSAQLGFRIDGATGEAIRLLAPTLVKISAERIAAELIKLLTSKRPGYLRAAYETGITAVILPEFDALMRREAGGASEGELSLAAAALVRPDKALRFAALFYRMDERSAGGILRRLKLDNDTIRTVTRLVRLCPQRIDPAPAAVRRAVYGAGRGLFPLLMELQGAVARAEKRDTAELLMVQSQYETICRQGQCVSLKTLALTGKDLIALGCPPGPGLGKLLEEALQEVLDEPEKNTEEYLREFVKSRL